ncbi:hypothetical protein EYF80_019162 [Liparis tanakae]|uniref:Uncharacterized protein n=1 Tax=Liparis tanakae TaxID=230148 RepID=A0A4Z2HY44_9TELE|nr:hypothetical protein EYF80_019162 [Liparis tanakae]
MPGMKEFNAMKINNFTTDLMGAGTTERCSDAQVGAIEKETDRQREEKRARAREPAAHSHKTLTSCLSVLLSTQEEEEEEEALTHTRLITSA